MYLYDRFNNNKWHKFQKSQSDVFLKLLSNISYNKTLDIGCGKGYWDYLLIKNNLVKSEVVGIDIFNDFQIDELKSLNSNLNVQFSKIENYEIPYTDNSFDLVYSMDVIEHIEDDIASLKEHIRVTKKGGTILIGTPNYYRVANIILMMVGKLKYPRVLGKDSYGEVIHLREYSLKNLKTILNLVKDDVHNVEITSCWFGIMPTYGISNFPKIFNNFCQFWFVKMIKV